MSEPTHPHVFRFNERWCETCTITELELFLAPRDSILWKECRLGLVGEYLRALKESEDE